MTLQRLAFRVLLVVLVIGFFVAWTAVPEPELVLAGMGR